MSMRTTLTLDSDVAASVKREMRQKRTTLKETVNSALRAALPPAPPGRRRKPYVLVSRNLGIRTDKLPSKILAEMDEAEDVRKLREGR
jgi:hypothetical protein